MKTESTTFEVLAHHVNSYNTGDVFAVSAFTYYAT